jgi:parallel beta-helix repeat protein
MLSFNVEPVEGWTGTIYIWANGYVDPPDAPIVTYDYTTYTLTDNITSTAEGIGIIVERDNIIINGAGYTVQGPGYMGISLFGSNVTIKDINIINYSYAIYIGDISLNNSIVRSNIENNRVGISLEGSSNNRISRNNIINNVHGIILSSSSNNTINNNKIMHSFYGITFLYNSKYNSILGNNYNG